MNAFISVSRFHDKVVIEEELNELRSKNGPSWETTKYHLKLAKTNTSLRNIEQLTLVNGDDVDHEDEDDFDDDNREDGMNGRIKNGAHFSQSETQFIDNAS